MKQLKLPVFCLVLLNGFGYSQTYFWTQKNDFPIQRYAVAAFSIGNFGYFVSGKDIPSNTFYNDSWRYDPLNDSWTQSASLPAMARYGASAFSIGNSGYVGCGWGSIQLKDFWKYDVALNSWTQIPDLPGAPRYTAFGVSDGTKGYVGLGYSPLQDDCYAYNPATNSWTAIPNFPGGPRQAASTFCLNGLIYVCGGADANTTYNDLYMYNPATNIWTQKTSIPGPGRDGSVGFSINGKGFVGSGYVYPTGYNNDFYIYDAIADSWTQGPTWPTTLRIEARSFVINNLVYVGCGYWGAINQCFKDVWTLTLQGATPIINIASTDSFWCDKAAVDFFDLSTNNPASWQWYFPGAVPDTSTLQNPTGIYYAAPGNYDVKLVACNAFGCDSITFTSFINEYLPPPVPLITQSYDTLRSSTAYSYQWFELNSPSLIISTDPYLVVTQPGSYFVIISDSLGCITPSVAYVFTSLNDLNQNELNLIANFNNEGITVMSPVFENENVLIEIYDAIGQLILSKKYCFNKSALYFPVQFSERGIYFLKVSSKSKSKTVRFIVN